MRKPGIILTGIFILAIVSGALAYKFGGNMTLCLSAVQGGTCHFQPVTGYVPVQMDEDPTFYYTIKPATQSCTVVTCPNGADQLLQ